MTNRARPLAVLAVLAAASLAACSSAASSSHSAPASSGTPASTAPAAAAAASTASTAGDPTAAAASAKACAELHAWQKTHGNSAAPPQNVFDDLINTPQPLSGDFTGWYFAVETNLPSAQTDLLKVWTDCAKAEADATGGN